MWVNFNRILKVLDKCMKKSCFLYIQKIFTPKLYKPIYYKIVYVTYKVDLILIQTMSRIYSFFSFNNIFKCLLLHSSQKESSIAT